MKIVFLPHNLLFGLPNSKHNLIKTFCFLKSLRPSYEVKVRDHCHLRGNFRGAVNFQYNLLLHNPRRILIFFHNIKAYDSPLNMQPIHKFNAAINVIAQSTEKSHGMQSATYFHYRILHFVNKPSNIGRKP